jgi:3',5'-cyclic AMP phosphodiesterase CpdA
METLFAWIHLSDIHMGHGGAGHIEDQRLVLAMLCDDIVRLMGTGRVPRPDAILVTGDIAFSGNCVSNTEYERAAEWLRRMGTSAGLGSESIFVIPGNHDVQRQADKSRNIARLLKALRSGEQTLDEALRHDEDRALLSHRLANYQAFAKGFAPACLSDAGLLGDGLYWHHQLTARGGLKVRLAGLNTALLSADEAMFGADHGRLRLGEAQFVDALGVSPPREEELVIVLSHHPLQDGWLADQSDTAAWVRRLAQVNLSGHVHEAASEEARSGAGGIFTRITAGAVHGERESQGIPARHGYNFAAAVSGANGLRLRVWPRKWSAANRDFRRDTDVLPEGADHAEHALSQVHLVPGPGMESSGSPAPIVPGLRIEQERPPVRKPGKNLEQPRASDTSRRESLYEGLSSLLPAQFEEVLFRLNVPRKFLPDRSAEQSIRALKVLQWVEQDAERRYQELARILEDVTGRRGAGRGAHLKM